jgi:serine/threonine protein kinase
MPRLFISYSHSDIPFLKHLLLPPLVDKYGKDLVWHDDEIVGGSDWEKEIHKQIADCDLVIYLISNESLESIYCQDEIIAALQLGKPILPLVVRRLKPEYPGNSQGSTRDYLLRTQAIDLSKGITDSDIFDRIHKSIHAMLFSSSSKKGIQGFTLIKTIGTGSFGEVYLAQQKPFNRVVVLKVIPPLYAKDASFVRRFEQEAKIIAKLEHANIVPVYDLWHDNDGAYVVMRYMRGGNLADKLINNQALSIELAAKLLEQIASALYVAHRNRVIHQDIKPANILFDDDNNAYLSDFGIANNLEANVNLAEDDSVTMHGSPKYIAPEHLRRKEITYRSDIYSLGLVMYEALTGSPPYEGQNLLELLQHHILTPTPNLQEKAPHLSSELDEPIKKATAKKPEERYDNVLKFAEDFRKIANRL